MKKHDKTKTYSDSNKTTTYGDSEKRTKETVHNLKAGDNIILNNKEYKILEIISESTGEAVIYKIESVTPKSPKGDFAAATKKSPSGDLGAKQAKANFNQKQKIYALKLYFEFKDAENEPNTEALSRIKNIKDIDILCLYDFGTGINKYKGKYCFEISDFAHGHDLLKVENLKEKYKPDFIEKELISQIFKGILRLHENRIYHCDLKPQNVFYLDKEQIEIVIGDYGSAKTFEFDAEKKSRKTTTVKGTDFYLPPEQARGFISEKNDYYSFGMILLHLFYPEKILLNENSLSRDNGKPKSLSHSKLKQIIERQFEAKPIIDFNPKFKRINSLIEGLTLVDFNLRWGKEQVEQWIEGRDIDLIYRESTSLKVDLHKIKEQSLKFGEYTLSTPDDLRNYLLNDDNWYADLIEDEYNKEDFIKWMLNLYTGDINMRTAFNNIIKYYSQEGVNFVADAVIRLFIPEHPVSVGMQSFNFAESDDILKTTTLAFSHLIFDLWKSSTDKDIKQFIFSYEFALIQSKNKVKAINILKNLYRIFSVNKDIESDFENYKVYAYTKINKNSLEIVKEFLLELSAGDIEIIVNSLDKVNNLQYKFIKSTSSYFKSIGIDNALYDTISENQTIALKCPEIFESLDDFIEKIYISFIENIVTKHKITNVISPSSVNKIKETLKKTYQDIIYNIENELSSLEKEFPEELKLVRGFSIDIIKLKKNSLQNIKFDKVQKIYEDILSLKTELEKVAEAKGILKQFHDRANESSLVLPLLKMAEKHIKSNNYKEIEKAWQILTNEHSFKCESLIDIRDIKKHDQISYEKMGMFTRIKVGGPISLLALSPDGQNIVVGNYRSLKILNIKRKEVVSTIENSEPIKASIAISKDSKKISCIDILGNKASVFDLKSGEEIYHLKEIEHYPRDVLFSADDKYLAIPGLFYTLLWDVKTWEQDKLVEGSAPICFHPFKNLLVSSNLVNEIILIDINTNESSIISKKRPNIIDQICFSPDGELIASSCRDDDIRIWDVTGNLVHVLPGHSQYEYSHICFSPDGKILASILKTGVVRFWSVATGASLLTLNKFNSVKGLAFHPSGKYIVVADYFQVILIYLKYVTLYTHKMNIPDFIIYEKKNSKDLKKIKEQSKN